MKNILERRSFIQQMGLLTAASMIPLSCASLSNKKKYKMGLQLYTIRDAMAEDPIGSLKTVNALGYQDLELYGYDGENDTCYGYKTSDFKKILEDHQLTTSSGHYLLFQHLNSPKDDLTKYVDQCIEGAIALDQAYITWPWLPPESRTLDTFKQLSTKLNYIGERVTKAGLGFAYHNHNFEFTDHNGETGYDILLRDTDPELVKLQIDLYWVMHSSKLSPQELIANQPGRYVMWHIKDMDKVTRDYTELGNGSIDYTKVLPDPELAGLEYYYLEQGGNFATNSMQSITDSATYFKEHIQKFL